jgi:hypothetical protein
MVKEEKIDISSAIPLTPTRLADGLGQGSVLFFINKKYAPK